MPPKRHSRNPRPYGRQAKGTTIKSFSAESDLVQWAEGEARRKKISFSAYMETLLAEYKAQFTGAPATPAVAAECAEPAPSTVTSQTSKPNQKTPANIVHLPPPPVVGSLLHDMAAETSNPPPVTEDRREVRYEKKRRSK